MGNLSHRERDRQTDRQRQTERQTDAEKDRETFVIKIHHVIFDYTLPNICMFIN